MNWLQRDCSYYVEEKFCDSTFNVPVSVFGYWFGAKNGFPEKNCCGCGKDMPFKDIAPLKTDMTCTH